MLGAEYEACEAEFPLKLFLSLNCEISSLSICAWPESSSDAEALSSLVAELVWTTAEICSIPPLSCVTAVACSSEAVAISSILEVTELTFSTTSKSEVAVSSAIFVPLSIALIAFSISAVVFFAASADLPARFLTSSATTANPLPAAPARAASTAAFNARIFV